MARIETELRSELPPERIIAALTDMTARRPELWPGLNPKEYRVYEVGDTWAVIREGNGGAVWARERYDWSVPGSVTWTVEDSGFSTPGDFVTARIEPDGSGSHIHLTRSRRGRGIVGRVIVALMLLTRGAMIRRSVQSGLEAIARQPA